MTELPQTIDDCECDCDIRERERIIKLLEELDIKVFGRLVYNDSREELIALIKGEN